MNMYRFWIWLAGRLSRWPGRFGEWVRGHEIHGRALSRWEMIQSDARRWATMPGGALHTGDFVVDSRARGEEPGGGIDYLLHDED